MPQPLNAKVAALRDRRGQPMQAQIAQIPFTPVTASLTLLDTSGVLISKIDTARSPSLFGSMIHPFLAELTPKDATVIEAAMGVRAAWRRSPTTCIFGLLFRR